jgi:hypothetical protein
MISKNKNLKGRGTWAKNPDGVASLDERLEHFLSTLKIPERQIGRAHV